MSLLLLFSGSSDIAFDAASNSGYQAATSTASWSHTCTGSSRYLLVGVSMLSLAQTVTGITYNGVALTFLGSQNSVTGAARTELWGLVAPASGTNTIAVTLSGAIAWSGNASSYTNVNQAVPTEAWNAAQATNVGAADATVTVTTVADRDFTVDILATDDAAVTVGTGQTQTGNVTGAGGSGAMSYKGPKTPADATAMYWANVGALATWTIGSIALRPLAASSGTTISPPNGVITITGKTPALVQTIQAITGQIIISGGTPSVTSTLQAVAGQIVISGNTPSITTILQAVSGQVIIGGNVPSVVTGTYLAPTMGLITIAGGTPSISTTLQAIGGQLVISGGVPSIVTPSGIPSNEVVLHKWYKPVYIKRKGKILLFATAQEADDYIEAESKAQTVIAQKTSRRAKKRVRDKVYSVTLPKTAIEPGQLGEMISRYQLPFNLPELLEKNDLEGVLLAFAAALFAQDEEDIELLLILS